MFDPTKPVRTRDGRFARVLSTAGTRTMGPYLYPVVAEVEHPNRDGMLTWHFMMDGRWKSNDPANGNDLVNAALN